MISNEVIYKLIPLKQAYEQQLLSSKRMVDNGQICIVQGLLRILKFGKFQFYDSTMSLECRLKGNIGMQESILLLNYRLIQVQGQDLLEILNWVPTPDRLGLLTKFVFSSLEIPLKNAYIPSGTLSDCNIVGVLLIKSEFLKIGPDQYFCILTIKSAESNTMLMVRGIRKNLFQLNCLYETLKIGNTYSFHNLSKVKVKRETNSNNVTNSLQYNIGSSWIKPEKKFEFRQSQIIEHEHEKTISYVGTVTNELRYGVLEIDGQHLLDLQLCRSSTFCKIGDLIAIHNCHIMEDSNSEKVLFVSCCITTIEILEFGNSSSNTANIVEKTSNRFFNYYELLNYRKLNEKIATLEIPVDAESFLTITNPGVHDILFNHDEKCCAVEKRRLNVVDVNSLSSLDLKFIDYTPAVIGVIKYDHGFIVEDESGSISLVMDDNQSLCIFHYSWVYIDNFEIINDDMGKFVKTSQASIRSGQMNPSCNEIIDKSETLTYYVTILEKLIPAVSNDGTDQESLIQIVKGELFLMLECDANNFIMRFCNAEVGVSHQLQLGATYKIEMQKRCLAVKHELYVITWTRFCRISSLTVIPSREIVYKTLALLKHQIKPNQQILENVEVFVRSYSIHSSKLPKSSVEGGLQHRAKLMVIKGQDKSTLMTINWITQIPLRGLTLGSRLRFINLLIELDDETNALKGKVIPATSVGLAYLNHPLPDIHELRENIDAPGQSFPLCEVLAHSSMLPTWLLCTITGAVAVTLLFYCELCQSKRQAYSCSYCGENCIVKGDALLVANDGTMEFRVAVKAKQCGIDLKSDEVISMLANFDGYYGFSCARNIKSKLGVERLIGRVFKIRIAAIKIGKSNFEGTNFSMVGAPNSVVEFDILRSRTFKDFHGTVRCTVAHRDIKVIADKLVPLNEIFKAESMLLLDVLSKQINY